MSKDKDFSRIPIEISNRHIHISETDFKKLFGNANLEVKRELSQPGQFAAEQTLILANGDRKIENVRIVGPFRSETQIELSVSDCRALGITPYFSLSGTLDGSPGITLEGPVDSISLKQGVIVALPHIHMSTEEAKSFGFNHLDKVIAVVKGARTVSFHDVVIRTREGVDSLAFHIDVDQANAVGNISEAKIVSIS
jgi:putative phosphotransacetylase